MTISGSSFQGRTGGRSKARDDVMIERVCLNKASLDLRIWNKPGVGIFFNWNGIIFSCSRSLYEKSQIRNGFSVALHLLLSDFKIYIFAFENEWWCSQSIFNLSNWAAALNANFASPWYSNQYPILPFPSIILFQYGILLYLIIYSLFC